MRTTCANGGGTTTTGPCTVTPTLTSTCYCAGVLPTAPTDDATGIRNVTFNTINNTSTAGAAYTNFTAVQTAVNAGQVYPMSVSVNTVVGGNYTVAVKAWMDWNRNAVFDANEEYDLGTATEGNPILTNASPLSITVPGDALAGATLMRVRAVYDGTGTPVPCGAQNYSEAEDYVLNVTACTAPTATFTPVNDCGNNQFSVAVNVASLGSGASANIRYTVNNGTPQFVNGVGLGTTNIGPFASTAVVAVSVNNGPPGCTTATTLVYSGCPTIITCGSTLNIDHCYQNNDPRTFLFESSNPFETVTVSFVSGTMDPNDVIRAYSGTDNSGTPIPSLTGSFGNLAGVSGTSLGSELFIEIDSDGSNSCASGQQTTWSFEAECTAGCVDPDGAATVTTNCGAFNFTIDVEVFFTGDAGTTTLRYTVNGGAPTDIPGLTDGALQNIGPFNIDDVVNVRLLHESDGTCDKNLGNFTDNNTCPPFGTDCISARPVNSYPYLHSSTTCGAGNEYGTQCSGLYGGGEDYVYKLIITNPGLYAINLEATGGGSYIGWFLKDNGSCTTASACLANATSSSGTTANGTYTFTAAGTYNLIVDTWPAPNCSAYNLQITYELCPTPVASAATGVTMSQASANWTGAAGTYLVEWGPAATFTTPGTGATPGVGGTVITNATSPQPITGLAPGTQYRYFVRRNCGVDGWSANSLGITFTTGAATPITQGACAQNQAITDDGCSSGAILNATFSVSGQPSTLGTNVGLSSVDIIITHTYREDLIVSLISPSGQEVTLIDQRGDDWNNFGANGTCPTGVFRLIDSGASLTTLPAANNAVGSWAPEQPLTGFNTGNPNGTWTLRICDNAAADAGQLRYVKLNFLPIDCQGVLGGTAMPGTACNDGDACTVGDTWSVGCTCAGTFHDTDNDGTCDASDGCPTDANKIAPGACGCGVADVATTYYADTDGDGFGDPASAQAGFTCTVPGGYVANNGDGCPTDGNKQAPGVCGCGVADVPTTYYADTDGDGFGDPGMSQAGYTCNVPGGYVANSGDGCPTDGNKQAPGACGCGVPDTDSDNDGLADCNDNCPNQPGQIGSLCDDGDAGTVGDTVTPACTCVGTPINACTTNLNIVFQTDGTSNVGWELREQGTDALVQSGGGVFPQSLGYSQATCVPNGCFYLVVTDDAGDGFTNGGYFLSTASGARIIDNRNNFTTGFTSQIAGGQGFCIPMGTDRLIYTSCDKLDWRSNEFIVANDNPGVNAAWTGGGADNNLATDGYELWFYDPNGGYSFRRYHSHATSDGFGPASAQRACHIQLNNWNVANHLPVGALLNVKVRSRLDGVNASWGTACRFKLDPVRAQCPLTKLMDIPGNQYVACGGTRNMGPGSLVHARPVTRLNGNGNVVAANKYQFRFRIPAENITVIKTSNTGQYWVPATAPLQPCKTYEVDVRASFDNGATWCTDFVAPVQNDPWGPVCLLSIACNATGGGQNGVMEDAALRMYPNPNRGDQLYLSIPALEADVAAVSVDIHDTFGKRVRSMRIAVQDGHLNTVIDLEGSLAAGMYVVNITAGERSYTERLVVQP